MPEQIQQIPLECSIVVAVIAAAVACFTLLRLARVLPGQNILMIGVCLLAGQALVEWGMIRLGEEEASGPMGGFLVGAALLWLAVTLGVRWLAQIILDPWRRRRNYGFCLLGLNTWGVILFQFGWPRLWPEPVDFKTALIMAGLRGVCTGIFLLVLSPWFIRKRPIPVKRSSELAQEPQNQAQQNADEQASR